MSVPFLFSRKRVYPFKTIRTYSFIFFAITSNCILSPPLCRVNRCVQFGMEQLLFGPPCMRTIGCVRVARSGCRAVDLATMAAYIRSVFPPPLTRDVEFASTSAHFVSFCCRRLHPVEYIRHRRWPHPYLPLSSFVIHSTAAAAAAATESAIQPYTVCIQMKNAGSPSIYPPSTLQFSFFVAENLADWRLGLYFRKVVITTLPLRVCNSVIHSRLL